MVEFFFMSALGGSVVGVLSGMLGIGGGTVMVPLLRLGFGLPAVVATATSMFTIIPTSLSGFIGHLRNKTCVPEIGVAAGIGGAFMSPLSALLADRSPSWLIMLAAAAAILYSSITMFTKARRAPRKSKRDAAEEAGHSSHAGQASFSTPARLTVTKKQVAYAAFIGCLAGFAAGYIGLGGGFLMVPLFMSILGMQMRVCSGTSLIAIMILAVPGVIMQGYLGNISYISGIALAIGAIPGALVGSNLVKYVPERLLRFIFAFFLLFAVILLVANEFAPLFLG